MLPEGVTDPYAIIGLPRPILDRSYAVADIRRAYRRKALALHPDKNPDDRDAAVKFNKLALVFEFLNDEIKRRDYDETIFSKERHRARMTVMDADRRRLAQELRRREELATKDKSDTPDFLRKKFKATGASHPNERKVDTSSFKKQAEANRALLLELQKQGQKPESKPAQVIEKNRGYSIDLDAFYILKIHWNPSEPGMITVEEAERNLRILLRSFQPFQILSCHIGSANIQFLSQGVALKAAMNLSLIEFDSPDLATCTVNPSIVLR